MELVLYLGVDYGISSSKKVCMVEFVKLMQGTPLRLELDDSRMEMYWQSNQWILEPIVRGRRYQCLIKGGEVNFSTIQGNGQSPILDKVQHIVEEIKQIIPDNTLIDGYITANNNTNLTLQILETSIERQSEDELKQLNFIISDVIYLKNKCIFENPLVERKNILKDFKFNNYINIIDTHLNFKNKEYNKLKKIFDSFYFKDLDTPYSFKKSSKWKIINKPEIYFCVIMDILGGKNGKYKNMCSTLSVGQFKDGELKKITNVGGMSMDNRIEFFINKKKYINTVVEIKALGRSDNNFIDARFSKLRNNLTPEDCVW